MFGNPLLRGEKVALSRVIREDVPLFARWFSNLELLRYLSTSALMPKTVEDEQHWFENIGKDGGFTFAIRLLENDQLIGSCGVHSPDWKNRCADVGIAIGDPDYWGKGYGTDAMSLLLRYSFLELNLHRVELSVYSYNARGIRSYEKLGFKHEGTRREVLFRDGQYHDIHIMGILRDEWLTRRDGG
jgi:RimJ/RimL family protein N-acetyltransferase